MTDTAPGRLQQFHRELEDSGRDYIHVAPPQPGCAQIRFTGPFEGRTVLWDASVMTLAHYRELASATGATPILRQFIGLNVARIDAPALLKTIIMIRKYKRLHCGRHEYGDATGATAGQPHGA